MNVTMAYLLEIVVGVFRDYGCGIESYITIHARKPGATTNELTTTTGFGKNQIRHQARGFRPYFDDFVFASLL